MVPLSAILHDAFGPAYFSLTPLETVARLLKTQRQEQMCGY